MVLMFESIVYTSVLTHLVLRYIFSLVHVCYIIESTPQFRSHCTTKIIQFKTTSTSYFFFT